MHVIIILLALLLGGAGFFIGWLFDPTLGTLLMGAAILAGIVARMNQAGSHQYELLAAIREDEPSPSRRAIDSNPDPLF